MAITTHFGWFNGKLDISSLGESQLEEFISKYEGKHLQHDLYYDNRLLLKKNKYLSSSLAHQIDIYYTNRKEAEMPIQHIYRKENKYAA